MYAYIYIYTLRYDGATQLAAADDVVLAAATLFAAAELAFLLLAVADALADVLEDPAEAAALAEPSEAAEAAEEVVVVADAASSAAPPAAAVAVGALVISRQPVGRLAVMLADPAAAKYLSMLGRLPRKLVWCYLYCLVCLHLHIHASVLVDSVHVSLSSVRTLIHHLL